MIGFGGSWWTGVVAGCAAHNNRWDSSCLGAAFDFFQKKKKKGCCCCCVKILNFIKLGSIHSHVRLV